MLRTCNFLYKIVLDTQKLTFDFAYFCACSIAALFIMPFFSRRFSSEKSPTIAVASFFFFSSDYSLIAYVPLFYELFTFTKSTQYLILNASKGLYLEMQNPEGSSFQFFDAMRLSPPLFPTFRIFLKSSKGPHFYFLVFCN